MEFVTYLKLTLTTAFINCCRNTFPCDLQAIHCVKIQHDKDTTGITHQTVVGRFYYTKKCNQQTKTFGKGVTDTNRSSTHLAESLKYGPEAYA